MKSRAKRFLGGLMASVMTLSTVTATTLMLPIATVQAASVTISEASGWYESAYVKWSSFSGAAGYAVYVKKSSGSYTQLDNQLIRSYGSYWRADAVGLSSGSYSMRVDALDKSGNVIASAEKSGLSVSSFDRSGSAFSSSSQYGSASGAYNSDGTLKSNARVIYITADTAKTVTADVVTSSKGTTTTCTGFQGIINGLQKGYETRPFDFRIVGLVDAEDMDAFGSSAEGLQIKGKAAYSNLNLTIEGIGEDATIKNFGILVRNAANVEIRNFAIMLCMDDALSLDTNNCNIWVHNMDCFYGNTGGDADQAKGDGTMDVKSGSTYVTFSYNHFWDNGKSSLCGMKSEKPEYFITYHHNWFDHSDSRHPRIRTMSVHIYNNYFDSCAKYGVGMTMGGSAFVENNYFLDCTKPMMISGQGTDAAGAGTFSGEAGGVIKAYNNTFAFDKVSSSKLSYITQANSATSFDAVEVSSRTAKVDSSYKAVSGGSTYNNFDTSWDLGVKSVDSVSSVPSIVKAQAGRMNGGDFPASRSYTALTDATSYSVDNTFKNALGSYKSSLVSIGGGVSANNNNTQATTVATTQATTKATTEATTEATTKAATTTTKAAVTEAPTQATTQAAQSASGYVSMGTYKLNSSTVTSKTATYANMVFNVRSVDSSCVKLRSDNTITFKTNQSCTLTANVSGKGLIIDGTQTGTGSVSVALSSGSHTITGATSGSNSSLSELVFSSSSKTVENTTVATTKATTTKATTEATTEATTKTTKTTTTTTEKTTEATTKAQSSASGSLSFSKDKITVAPGASASFNVSASGAYYIEQSGASWWFESDFLNLWGSNDYQSLTSSSQKFTINQWCGLDSGYEFTLTAYLKDDPSVSDTLTIVVK